MKRESEAAGGSERFTAAVKHYDILLKKKTKRLTLSERSADWVP